MINIRPVSDLRNKYPEIEKIVLKENEEVYLTKNGYGTMVVMSIERYSEMLKKIGVEKMIENKFGNIDIEDALDEADKVAEKGEYMTHEEVFDKLRRELDE